MRIRADATTPAAVNQVFCIAYNSATQVNTLSSSLSPVPSVNVSYEIYRPYTMDGVHPSSDGYRLMSTMVDISKIK
jgi:lysophospholipase L1-like esterase